MNQFHTHPPVEQRRDAFLLSTDTSLLDVAAIHSYLAERSYWARGISREAVERSIKNSLCFGVYESGRQVAFARVISDATTFAYLCDVFVLEGHRGAGLGKWLLDCVLAHPQLQGLRRFMLATQDAHGLYRPFGFREPAHPERYMEILRPGAHVTDAITGGGGTPGA